MTNAKPAKKSTDFFKQTGWSVFGADKTNLPEGTDIAIRELPLEERKLADCTLHDDGNAACSEQAKQSSACATSLRDLHQRHNSETQRLFESLVRHSFFDNPAVINLIAKMRHN